MNFQCSVRIPKLFDPLSSVERSFRKPTFFIYILCTFRGMYISYWLCMQIGQLYLCPIAHWLLMIQCCFRSYLNICIVHNFSAKSVVILIYEYPGPRLTIDTMLHWLQHRQLFCILTNISAVFLLQISISPLSIWLSKFCVISHVIS